MSYQYSVAELVDMFNRRPYAWENYIGPLVPKLTKARGGFRCGCPIHRGEDENFSVEFDKSIATCFSHGCVTGADIIGFIRAYHGYNVPDAVRELRAFLGITDDAPYTPPAPRPEPVKPARVEPALDESYWLKLTEWRTNLHADADTMRYLAGRGISAEWVNRFSLGLVGDGPYAGWLAIPYHLAGVGLMGIKYRNPRPDKLRYVSEKGSQLSSFFYMHHALEVLVNPLPDGVEVPKPSRVIPFVFWVEGELDAVAISCILSQSDDDADPYKNAGLYAIASPSNSLNAAKVDALLKSGKLVVRLYDNDEAGYNEARALYERVPSLAFATTEGYKDIGDMIKADPSAAAAYLMGILESFGVRYVK